MVSDRGPGTPVLDPPEGPDLAGLGKVEISYQIVIKTKWFPTWVLEPPFWTPRTVFVPKLCVSNFSADFYGSVRELRVPQLRSLDVLASALSCTSLGEANQHGRR